MKKTKKLIYTKAKNAVTVALSSFGDNDLVVAVPVKV